jgi:hypothetical protein
MIVNGVNLLSFYSPTPQRYALLILEHVIPDYKSYVFTSKCKPSKKSIKVPVSQEKVDLIKGIKYKINS